MKDLFADLFDIQEVQGVWLLSFGGDVLYEQMVKPLHPGISKKKVWLGLFVHRLEGMKILELIYETKRIFIQKMAEGYLFVLCGKAAPMAMIRLQCGLLASEINHRK